MGTTIDKTSARAIAALVLVDAAEYAVQHPEEFAEFKGNQALQCCGETGCLKEETEP